MWKVGGIKIEAAAGRQIFFYQIEMEIREKLNFFTLRPPPRKGREISGWVQWGEMMLTYRATNALLTNSGCGAVVTVKLGDAGKTRVAS